MTGWVRSLLFLLGVVIAASATAYFTGLLDPWFAKQATQSTIVPPAAPTPQPKADEATSDDAVPDSAASDQQASDVAAGSGSEPAGTARQDRLVAPDFDLLRVEPDGSVVVAGKAGAKALIELLSGDKVLGSVTAGDNGDFVIVLDEQIAPGDYQLALRATAPGDEAVLSAETATISIPKNADGEVLAMIDKPGAPAQLVTIPQAKSETGTEPQKQPAAEAPIAVTEQQASDTAPAASQVAPPAAAATEDSPASDTAPAVATETGEAEASATPQQATAATIVVEAVEIEGDTVFVAGHAVRGHDVRVYADDLVLGEAPVSDAGRFLVEAKRDLAVGNYMIRADLIDKSGNVVARAVVPFEREPGETIAAVAPAPSAATTTAGQEATQNAQTAPKGDEVAQAGEKAKSADANLPAASAEPETAAPLQRADGAVIIRRGDSLWRISRRVYGHGIRYSTIYLANQDQISDPDRIWPGQVFALPGKTPEGDQADLDAIGDQAVEP